MDPFFRGMLPSHRDLSNECESDSDCSPEECCSVHGFCGKTSEYCRAVLRCRVDEECGPSNCCSKAGFCGDTDEHCAEKTVCERDADCEPDQCCSNANACVFDPYFCSDEDAEDFYSEASSDHPTEAPSSSPSAGPSKPLSPMPTYMPQVFPSSGPSDQPSNGLSPSPSYSPTLSEGPSSSPSFFPTLSFTPSSSPSVSPISSPSGSPTRTPSPAPTNLPSTSPSTSPSYQATVGPSPSPSFPPTISAEPSSSPSISPSETKMPRTSQIQGGGIVTQCVFPNEVDESITLEFANLVAVNVDYRYIINVDTDMNLSTTLGNLERVFHEQIVSAKLDCAAVRRKTLRRLMHNRPTAISTLKVDTRNFDATCDQSQKASGFDCLVIDGGITAYYQNAESVTKVEVRTEFLDFAKEWFEEEGSFDDVGRVKSGFLVGASTDDDSDGETQSSEKLADSQTVRTAPASENETSLSGWMIFIIAFLCVLVIVVLFIAIRCKLLPRRRQREKLRDRDADVTKETNACSGSTSDDHTYDSLEQTGTENAAEDAALGATLLRHSERTLLRSNRKESKAVVLSDEYDNNDRVTVRPNSALMEGSVRQHEHDCVDSSLCLVCASQNRNRSTSDLSANQVELEAICNAEVDSDNDDEDAATSSSGILNQDTQRIYEMANTVVL